MISSSGTPSSSLGRGCRATLMADTPARELEHRLRTQLRRDNGPVDGIAQCAFDHHLDQCLAIGPAGVNIVSWIGRRGGRRGAASDSGLRHGASFKRAFGRAKANRAIANTDGTDTDVAKFLFHFIE